MNLNTKVLAKIAGIPIADFPSKTNNYIHLGTVAVLEGNSYTELPDNICRNTALVDSVKQKDSQKIATEILKAVWSDFGLEHDESIVTAYALNQRILPTEIIQRST